MMTIKEYLCQAYRLDQRINSDLQEVSSLREMATSIAAPPLKEHVQTSRNENDAPFVRSIEKIMELEHHIDEEIDLYVDLKEQIRSVISTVENTDERMVLKYRYVHNYTWEQIGNVFHVDARTVRRWHGKALLHVHLPINPIKI
jgi:DNA-directed RNA polymerase specialized sigma subunit